MKNDGQIQGLKKEFLLAKEDVENVRKRIDELSVEIENLIRVDDVLKKEIKILREKEDHVSEEIIEKRADRKDLEGIKKNLKQKHGEFEDNKKLIEGAERLKSKFKDSLPTLQEKVNHVKGSLLTYLFEDAKNKLAANIDLIIKAWACNALTPAEAGYKPASWYNVDDYKDLLLLLFPLPSVKEYEAGKKLLEKEISEV